MREQEPEKRDAAAGLARSRTDRWLLGVCGGFAHHFAAPVWLVRLLAVVSLFATLGLSAIAYLILAVILPEAGDAEG
jgi:phage shock protein PspC (stress-responsive transcriptional regulator)